MPNRQVTIQRQPLGVAGLIIAANTPIANVAWKVFPALMCGNAAVLKASEDTPETALAFARLAAEAGVPAGVLNVVQGLGPEAGQPLVEDPRVAIVSFTGSTAVGRMIARVAGERLAKVCLELGGKNPLVVCDDADLDGAAARGRAVGLLERRPALRGRQPDHRLRRRLRARSRRLLLERTSAQRVGTGDEDDLGPVINERQLENMLRHVRGGDGEGRDGARRRPPRGPPRLLHGADPDRGHARARRERAVRPDHHAAPRRAASTRRSSWRTRRPYGLTAAIWTASVHRGQEFVARIRSGVAAVNGPTYGSEPHWPFGGAGRLRHRLARGGHARRSTCTPTSRPCT